MPPAIAAAGTCTTARGGNGIARARNGSAAAIHIRAHWEQAREVFKSAQRGQPCPCITADASHEFCCGADLQHSHELLLLVVDQGMADVEETAAPETAPAAAPRASSSIAPATKRRCR